MKLKKKESLIDRDKLVKGLRNPKQIPKYLYEQSKTRLFYTYAKLRYQNYEDIYLALTKDNVKSNPEAAVGPEDLYEEMQEWQINFLTRNGLSPDSKLLDIGCGVLRGGIPMIEFLDDSNYYGVDISEDALEVANKKVKKHNLGDKNPVLIQNQDLKFEEPELSEKKFDFIWAQSVITHLPPKYLSELLENVSSVMSEQGIFYATYWESETNNVRKRGETDFFYPFSKIKELARSNKLDVTKVPANHPNDLKVLKFELS